MDEHNLDRHLKAYCDMHEEYQNLYATWSLNRKSCSEILKNVLLRYPHYSLHDASHAEAILSKIEMLLGDRIEQLSPTDTWLVLHAAYAHDLGMVVQWRELQEAWSTPKFKEYLDLLTESEDKDLREAVLWLRQMEKNGDKSVLWPLRAVRSVQLIDAAYFRSQHASMSKNYIERISQGLQIDLGHSGLVKNRLLQVLGDICACHTANDEQVLELPHETNGFGSDYAHPRFAAMLLRLGDLLDVDNGRFNMVAEEMIGGLPATSEAHKEKHEATTHLLITPEKIEFSSNCPNESSYLEARRFVTWLKDEIHFLTNNWVRIVPLRASKALHHVLMKVNYVSTVCPTWRDWLDFALKSNRKRHLKLLRVLVFMKISWFSSENCYKMLWMLPKFSFGGIFVPELIRRGLVKKQRESSRICSHMT